MCRNITSDYPSSTEVARDYGGVGAAQLFNVARMKERVWHSFAAGTQLTLHTWLRRELGVVSDTHAILSRLVNDTGPNLITTLPSVWPEPIQLTWSLQRHGDCRWAKKEIEIVDRRTADLVHALLAAGFACLIIAIALGC